MAKKNAVKKLNTIEDVITMLKSIGINKNIGSVHGTFYDDGWVVKVNNNAEWIKMCNGLSHLGYMKMDVADNGKLAIQINK